MLEIKPDKNPRSNEQMEDQPQIKPHSAYHKVADGMNHYYFQLPDGVIHINQESILINRLHAGHLQDEMHANRLVEISVGEYMTIAVSVLGALGFELYAEPLPKAHLN